MFLKNKNIIFKIRRSKVTDYAALKTSVVVYNHTSVVVYNHNVAYICRLKFEPYSKLGFERCYYEI